MNISNAFVAISIALLLLNRIPAYTAENFENLFSELNVWILI